MKTYRELIDEGAFPHQTRITPGDADAQKPNNSLLVIGSLAWYPQLPGYGFDSMSKQLFNHFASAAWSNDIFHAFGLIRSLLWMQSDEFNPMVSQSVTTLQKVNCHLGLASDIDVVVRAERKDRLQGKGSHGREPNIEIESIIRTLRAGRENGFKLPSHRRDYSYDFAKHFEEATGGTGIVDAETMYEYIYAQQLAGVKATGLVPMKFIERVELQKEFTKKNPEITFEASFNTHTRPKTYRKATEHPNYEGILTVRRHRASLNNSVRTKLRIEKLLAIGEEMYLLECKALDTPDGPEKEALLKQIEEMDVAWEEGFVRIELNYHTAVVSEMDDRLQLRYPPYPRVPWDRRSYEPLIMYEKEAWPRERLSLISATPKPRPTSTTPDFHDWVHDFIYGLYIDSSKPITEALESMFPGLSEIIEDCPSLRDPKKGGRLQMKHLRVRMLSNEQLYELVENYITWPFKSEASNQTSYFRNQSSRFTKPRQI